MATARKAPITAKPAVRSLIPKSADTKYTGDEPEWRLQPTEHRAGHLSKALSWYGYFYGKKEAKDMVLAWMEYNDAKLDAKRVRTLPDSAFTTTLGFMCRMNMVGLELNDRESLYIADGIEALLALKQAPVKTAAEVEAADAATAAAKPNIQDRLREKVSECAGEMEGLYDDFRVGGCKLTADFKPMSLMRGMNIAPQMVSDIATIWKNHQAELETALKGKDAQLVEGYSHLGRNELKNMVKFCEAVVNDCGAYVQIKKVERKPRKKKAVPPEKQAAKFKFLREFPELKLTSEPAHRLVNCAEAWMYHTKKRKLIHVVADSHVGTFTVKNNAIIGFDTTETIQKTLRKPAEQIKALMTGGKPAARKLFKDIKATETKFNGRGTEDIVILKAW
jgi:hypothetical protein